MAADASIYGQIATPAAPVSPVAAMQAGIQMATLQDRRRQLHEQAAEREFVASVWKDAQGDPDRAIEIARSRGAGPMAMALEAEIGKMRSEAAKGIGAQIENETKQLEIGRSIVQTIRDQGSLLRGKALLSRLNPEIGGLLPTAWDPATTPQLIAQFAEVGLQSADILARRKQAWDELQQGPKAANDWRQTIATALAGAPTPELWHTTQQTLRQVWGAPAEMLAEFGEFSPENQARAESFTMTPKERAETETAQMNAATARMNAEKAATAESFTLSPGQQRFDAQGNRIASVAPRPTTAAGTAQRPGRQVVSGDANRLADYQTSLEDLNALETAIGETGTLSKIQSWMPQWVNELTGGWGDDAKSRNAVIARVKQVIGKALEGGVLRKEDEEKYKDILPTIYDSVAVAKSKIHGLRQSIAQRRSTLLDSLSDAGYDTSRFAVRQGSASGGAKTPTMRYNPATGKVEPIR